MKDSKEVVHELYNDISENCDSSMDDVKEVLLKVYKKLDRVDDDVPVINRLVNFLYFKGFTEGLKFTKNQDKLITELSHIGRKAGLNGSYRADYTAKSQFD